MEIHEIVTILSEHPELKERIGQILSIVIDAKGETKLADEAERQVIEGMRLMGHDALQAWAKHQAKTVNERAKIQKPKLRKHEKKNSFGIQRMEKSK